MVVSTYKIGDRTVSKEKSDIWGNVKYQYNPTEAEKKVTKYTQSQLMPLYEKMYSGATDNQKHVDDYMSQWNEAYKPMMQENLKSITGGLVAGDQLHSSMADKAYNDFTKSVGEDHEQAGFNALQYANSQRTNDFNYINGLLGTANGAYNQLNNTSNSFFSPVHTMNQYGDSIHQRTLAQMKAADANKGSWGDVAMTAAGVGLMFVPGAQGIGASMAANGAGGMASKGVPGL